MDAHIARQQLPDLLLQRRVYPHPCAEVRLIETHMSWLFLTGEFAYKVKKPIHFDFVDFSTVERRRYFCEEEMRLNSRFAPSLYLGVVAIVTTATGELRIDDDPDHPDAIEWAIRMHQFDPAAQADHLLKQGDLSTDALYRFGEAIAEQHQHISPYLGRYDAAGPMRDNFTTLRTLKGCERWTKELETLEAHLAQELIRLEAMFTYRQTAHHVKECHGDLHLSNIVRLEEGLCAFDCLEFDEDLRNIDVMCDTGFLFMDCLVRDRADLAYAFIDGYLNVSGDYAGAALLPIFADYRSMVRAKVAGLRVEQAPEDLEAADKLALHIRWNISRVTRPPGRLIIMCGVSGTGKSHWAAKLVSAVGAIRIRSDVLRKVQHGLAIHETSGAAIGQGMYAAAHSAGLYQDMANLAKPLLMSGENVIIDAASLKPDDRQALYAAAEHSGATCQLVYLTAPPALLHRRIRQRNAQGNDPSEADGKVLDWQLAWAEPPSTEEPVITVDTTTLTLQALLGQLADSSSSVGGSRE